MDAFLLGLRLVPTVHLAPALAAAISTRTGDYALTAGSVHKAYEEQIKPHLAARHQAESRAKALPPGKSMTREEWKRLHNLPPQWKLGDPYPPQSDLFGTEGQALAAKEAAEVPVSRTTIYAGLPSDADEYWSKPEKAAWELYPDREHAWRKIKGADPDGNGGVEWLWWMDRCVEMEFPSIQCPGYVVEHFGPEGGWSRKVGCPIHNNRLK